MKRAAFRIIALVMVLCLMFSGCSLFGSHGTAFEDMEYTRPSPSELTSCADRCVELAQTATDMDTLWPEVSTFFDLYSDYFTQYLLSYVHYCQDMTDTYWTEEYNFCEEQSPQVEASRDHLLHELAKSSLREELEGEDYFGADYFDAYDGESIWTDQFQALNEQEAKLMNRYYEICQEGAALDPYSDEYFDSYGIQLEELYIELVAVRQQLALEAGYDSYPEYAYEQSYYRDYTPKDAMDLCNQISSELTPLYLDLAYSGFWNISIYASDDRATLQYVQTMATNMGGEIEQAMELMTKNNLYDISYRANKFDGSFEVYLYDYAEPFVFVSPAGSEMDHLSLAHEFGHFCNDHVSDGSVVSIDTAEVFSQGMEYLSLFYSNPSDELTLTKLGDTLCVYVEQAAYSYFEQQVYGLSKEELTIDNLRSIFEETCEDFGMDCWGLDSRSYVGISHFFTQPLYTISYVVSNDAAFQLYQLEQQQQGAGLEIYLEHLDTEQEYFLPFLEEAGLDSPFEKGRIQKVRNTLEDALL